MKPDVRLVGKAVSLGLAYGKNIEKQHYAPEA
jgi:hypothetical protein